MCECAAGYDGENEEERGEQSSRFGSLTETFAKDGSVEFVEVCNRVFTFAECGLCRHFEDGDVVRVVLGR